MSIDEILAISPVIPVVTFQRASDAVPTARALSEGGVNVIEVTLRTESALESIEHIARELPSITVLAGTACHGDHVKQALAAGARGVVSPGLTEALARAVEREGALWLPGVATASDILIGMAFGYERFKLFPASVAGGPDALRAFAGPFPAVRFCPTGGIDRGSLGRYLELPNVACVGGSWIATERLLKDRDWRAIQSNAEYVAGLRSSVAT